MGKLNLDLFLGAIGAGLVHGVLFSQLALITPANYEVVVAPSSLEVTLTASKKKEELKKEDISIRKVIEHEIEEVQKVEERIEKVEKEEQRNLQGAIAEAKPLIHFNKPPYYPRLARLKGYEGKVMLKVKVSSEGYVKSVNILKSSGYAILDRQAERAIRNWRFTPAEVFGAKIESTVNIPVRFQLESS